MQLGSQQARSGEGTMGDSIKVLQADIGILDETCMTLQHQDFWIIVKLPSHVKEH